MSIPIYQVDAFVTDKPFSGNPAAACILPPPADEKWMQNVAMEMNLSETAFLVKQTDRYNLRWFTPTTEVDLCGHATLASAHVLWETGLLKPNEQARFHTKSGLLTATRNGGVIVRPPDPDLSGQAGRQAEIELDFPLTPEEPAAAPPELLKALGVKPLYTGKPRSAPFRGKSLFDYIIEVESEETLRSLQPDFEMLKSFSARGVIVTSRSSSGSYDFVSRFFCPGSGIAEDPVTGSAHCCLGPYWKARLKKSEFIAYQASQRGGLLRVRVGDGRVYLSGKAVTMLRGELA